MITSYGDVIIAGSNPLGYAKISIHDFSHRKIKQGDIPAVESMEWAIERLRDEIERRKAEQE